MTSNPSDYALFICHNGQDSPIVHRLARMLRDSGLSVWLDEWEHQPGIPWIRQIEFAIGDSRAAAVLVGPHGNVPWQDAQVYSLLEQAAIDNRPVIPVLLPGVGKEPELPQFLSGRNWVDLRKGITEDGLAKIHSEATGQKR